MLVFVRLPSLHDNFAFWVNWNKGALRGNCRQKHGKTSFFPIFFGFSPLSKLSVGSGVKFCGTFG